MPDLRQAKVDHDIETWFFSVLSSRTCFGISVLVLESVFKSPPCERGFPREE